MIHISLYVHVKILLHCMQPVVRFTTLHGFKTVLEIRRDFGHVDSQNKIFFSKLIACHEK